MLTTVIRIRVLLGVFEGGFWLLLRVGQVVEPLLKLCGRGNGFCFVGTIFIIEE